MITDDRTYQVGYDIAITERARVEEELRGQALIFENIHDGIIMTDLEGNIIRWNPAAERMFGYYKEEAFRKTLSMLTTRITKGQLHDGRWAGEMDFTRKDGTRGVCETTVIPLRDEHGTITAVFGVSRDITERKQAEEKVKRLATVVRDSSDAVTVQDFEGRITNWNHGAELMYGYSEEEALKMNIGRLTPPTKDAEQKEFTRRLIAGETVTSLETQRVTKDGRILDVWLTVTKLMDDTGKPIGIASTERDITERKQAEQTLQRSYDKLRETLITTVNALASAAEMRDPYTAGHQRRVTTLVCAIAEEMGLTQEQFDGLRLAGLIHDIGKINIPAEILNKPGMISELEFNIIATHPQSGYNILKEIEFPWPIAQIVLQHHERLDGSGYPQGLKDGGIMLEARILAVADVVEAMASHRPYRPALGIEAALAEITNNKGILYDPEVVDSCQRLFIEKGFTIE
jgi:PAS domain S-box-containing protein/putative nucleotidyltransferase with HDIG domain